VDRIIEKILESLRIVSSLAGVKVLVTAGPTVEDIDPIRFLSNRSSGKMGYAVVEAALQRGAEVFLVSGPTGLKPPSRAHFIPVRSAAQMRDAVLKLFPDMDIVVKAAAVADYRPIEMSTQKIKKHAAAMTLHLARTDDILDHLGKEKGKQILIGFAAETEHLMESAREKMKRKNLDLLVANDVSRGVFGSDTAAVHIVNRSGETLTLQEQPKLAIAARILDLVQTLRLPRKD